MSKVFAAALRRATRRTQARNLTAATRIIQKALSQQDAPRLVRSPTLDKRMKVPLGEALRTLRSNRLNPDAFAGLPGMQGRAPGATPPQPLPEGARFLAGSYAGAAGGRSYKLYVPTCAASGVRGLVVMLHGCKQDPDDFAAGTRMNALAEDHGLLVLYPRQEGGHNASACWNWFSPAHQQRGSGEPAILAGMTQAIAAEHGVPRDRIFAAGLSAGGAMAVVLSETYPDLYGAVAIHSGLAYGSANDVMSALSVMRNGQGPTREPAVKSPAGPGGVRLIVFHGSADQTVHPANAEQIIRAAAPSGGPRLASSDSRGSAGGRSYRRVVLARPDGLPLLEHWLIEGAGHAWSGGSPSGSYADPKGPDASAEAVRFFLEATSVDRDGRS